MKIKTYFLMHLVVIWLWRNFNQIIILVIMKVWYIFWRNFKLLFNDLQFILSYFIFILKYIKNKNTYKTITQTKKEQKKNITINIIHFNNFLSFYIFLKNSLTSLQLSLIILIKTASNLYNSSSVFSPYQDLILIPLSLFNLKFYYILSTIIVDYKERPILERSLIVPPPLTFIVC